MVQKVDILDPYNNKPKYLQILLIALTILGFESISFLSASFGDSSRIISITYRIIYLLIGVLVIQQHWFKGRMVYTRSIAIIIIYWILYFIKAIYDTTFDPETTQSMVSEFWMFAFFLCFVPIFPMISKIDITTLNYARKATFLLAILVNILGLTNNIMLVSQGILTRFLANEILNPITYGQTGVILIIMSYTYLFNQNKRYKYIHLLFIGLGLVNVGLAGSRGPILQLFLVLVFYIIYNFKKTRKLNLLTIFLGIFIVGLYFREYLFIFDSVVERILTTSFEEERTAIYAESWSRFIANPFFGSNVINEFAHNIFLGSLETMGFLGGILMLIIYKNALTESIALVKIKSTDWVALLLVIQLISALMSGAIWNGVIFWALLALVTNLYYHRNMYSETATV